MKFELAIFSLIFLLCPLAHAANTGDMFGDRGYVPATFWSPPLHDHADMFPYRGSYVTEGADMFGHVRAPGAFGIEDMFSAHDLGPKPDTPLFNWPGDPYGQ